MNQPVNFSPPEGFSFDVELPAGEGTVFVRIPAGIRRKRRLMLEYVRRLGFPGYFGWNWDAFYDCLCDLSLIEGVKQVILAHEDVPFEEGSDQRETYLRLLADAVQSLKQDPPIRLVVSFPPEHLAEVAEALADSSF